LFIFTRNSWHGRAHIGANGSADLPEKMDEKLKSENMQNQQFSVFVIFLEQSGQADVENGAMLTTNLFRCTSECTIS